MSETTGMCSAAAAECVGPAPRQRRRRAATVKTLPANGPIRCPRRGCEGEVVEVDVARRWNRIDMQDGHPIASTAGDYQFDADPSTPFICDDCLRPITLPDTYQPAYD